MSVLGKTLRTGALALAVCTAAAVGQADAQTTLRVSNWLPPGHPLMTDIIGPWGEKVEEVTDGRVKVEVMQAPIGKPPAQYDLIRNGAADVAYGVHGYTPNRFGLTSLVELPFLSNTSEALSVAYWRVFEEYLKEANEHEGVKVVTLFTHGPGEIYTTQDAVTSADQLNGAKYRVGGGLANMVAQKLGIVPVSAPSPQVYEILSNGVADGILFPAESVPFFKIDTVIKNGTSVDGGLYNTSFFIIMNQRTWDGLSEEDQKAIDEVSGETLARIAGQAWDNADTAGVEKMKSEGIEIIEADDAFMSALQEKLAGIDSVFLDAAKEKGIDGEAALKMLKEEVAKESK
ncbi:TRAP transporter substrate-binding protein [Amorphus orientalis]|uniref:TRAP-type C4-dicarboxylate transport system substrate-binding protein n=1 Tax=Amorphus orientalis TaxID=649198 RepID=A0AAE3VLG8_9HYPH|nr:TRAP transporter substrate-binding protein [Amorphus orientalis]MDQ0314210.1 TRAP-type C4-dicarboxylate transport system substrate-binding protein [Amorphus orientalis]